MAVKQFEIYNMKLKVGNKVMIDLFDPFLKPFFKDNHYFESFTRSKEVMGYVIKQPKLVTVNKDVVLVGRFVKVLEIDARQQLKNGKLLESNEKLESAPSSLFFIRLYDHKIMYLREMARAPFFSEFDKIISSFVLNRYNKAIEKRRQELTKKYKNDKDKGATKISNALKKEFPDIVIDFDAVTKKESIHEGLNKFDMIKSVSFKLKPQNDEEVPDIDELSEILEDLRRKTGKDSENVELETTLSAKNRNSLESGEVENILEGMHKLGGNASFKVEGKSEKGQKVILKNDQCIAKPKIKFFSHETIEETAEKVFDNVKEYIDDKLIHFGKMKNEKALKALVKKLKL